MDEPRRPSRFGAARRHTRQDQQLGSSSAREFHRTNTLAFDSVANERSGRPYVIEPLYLFANVAIPYPWPLPSSVACSVHHNTSWVEDGSTESFNFADDDEHKSERSQGPDKYTSGARIKASGQSISAPGSSITSSSCASSRFGVHDGVLNKNFFPPKTQGDFLANITNMTNITSITKRNTILNRGTAAIRKTMAYTTPAAGVLEIASAPTASKDIPRPQASTSGWLDRKAKPLPKPRTPLLMSKEKRMKLNNNEPKPSSPVISHYALRDRNKSSLFGHEPSTNRPFSLRKPGTRLGKRKKITEGSAAKPIALDSDTDSEPEVQAHNAAKKDIVEEVLNNTRRNGSAKSQEEKQPAEDLEEIALKCMARIHSCDVLIGIFQCNADLLFQGDRMCMRNIRGKYEKWPFKDSYIFGFDQLQDVWRYYVDEIVEIDVDEKDKIELLLDEAPYLAFKLPFAEEADQTTMQTFYDPAGSDVSKGYMVFRPTDEATGGDLVGVEEVFRVYADIHKIDGREQAKRHLEALVKDPFSYKASRRSRRRQSNGADAESSSESEDDVDGNVTVLTYPLPPCTSDIVTIIRRDVSRLKPRRYLNDNIIDYYFKRMMMDTLGGNELVQEKVLFLSSHFYARLRAGKGTTACERMEAGYKNVSTWLARSNVFNRSIIFIPVNKDLHWSLAVILNPGIAGSGANDEEAASCIAVLDPLGSYHRKAAIIRNLRAFLRMQWGNSQNNGEDEYAVDRVLSMSVKAPQQENSYDCGVYVLKFAEVILKNCLELGLLGQSNGVISKEITDDNLEALISSKAFSGEDITATRKQIRAYIETDASEYQLRKKEEKEKKVASKNQQQ